MPVDGKVLTDSASYDLDHLMPVSVYPANELWNLVPADRRFNQHVKRGRLASPERLQAAEPIIALTYANYLASPDLKLAIRDDVPVRFGHLNADTASAEDVAHEACRFIDQLAHSRNIARF